MALGARAADEGSFTATCQAKAFTPSAGRGISPPTNPLQVAFSCFLRVPAFLLTGVKAEIRHRMGQPGWALVKFFTN